MSISIRLLGPNDAPVLDRVAADVFDHQIRPESCTAFLTCPRHVIAVALDRDVVIGMGTGVEYFHPDKPSQFWINEVGVAPDYRRRGIGQGLMNALIEEAKLRGCSEAWLGTEADNLPARACYAKVPGGSAPEPFVMYSWDLQD